MRLQLLFATLCCCCNGAANAAPPAYQPLKLPPDTSARKILATQDGGFLVLANQTTSTGAPYHALVLRFDPNGVLSSTWTAPTSSGVINDLALDAQGNLYVAGTSSGDIPTINSTTLAGSAPVGFFMKLDASYSKILVSGGFGVTTVNAIAVDADGNVYVGGQTPANIFPNAFNPSRPPVMDGRPLYAFAVRMPPTMDRIDYSVLLGGPTQTCSEGGFATSACFNIGTLAGVSWTTSLTLDQDGALVIGGSTSSDGFPTTPGALDPQSQGLNSALTGGHEVSGFVAKLNLTGSALVYSTCTGYTFSLHGYTNVVSAVHVAPDGNVVVAGTAEFLPFAGGATVGTSRQAPFLAKLNASGTNVIFSNVFNGPYEDSNTVNDMVIDSNGNMWITGSAPSGQFAQIADPNPVVGTFVAEVPPSGSGFSRLYRFDPLSAGTSISVAGDEVVAMGSSAVIYRSAIAPASAVVGVFNAIPPNQSKPEHSVAPAEIITLYGVDLGPTPGAGAMIDQEGRITTTLAGLQVDFNGVPAPLLYAGPDQITLIVPWLLNSPMNVRKDGTLIGSIPVGLARPARSA